MLVVDATTLYFFCSGRGGCRGPWPRGRVPEALGSGPDPEGPGPALRGHVLAMFGSISRYLCIARCILKIFKIFKILKIFQNLKIMKIFQNFKILKLLYRHPTNSQTSYEFADILRIHRHPTNSQTSYECPKPNLFAVFLEKTYSARGGNRTGYRPVPARPQAAGPTTMLIPLRNPAFSAASYAQEMQALGIQESGRIWHLILK